MSSATPELFLIGFVGKVVNRDVVLRATEDFMELFGVWLWLPLIAMPVSSPVVESIDWGCGV
jgi:hypothetical protein